LTVCVWLTGAAAPFRRLQWFTRAARGPLLGLPSPWTLTAMIAGVILLAAGERDRTR
jgi:hypothetical protein